MAAVCLIPASAQTPLGKKDKKNKVEAITTPWNSWTTAGISGKFRMSGLPLSPSVKIFMERDSSIMISLRAPLMGEVGRAEIDSDSILVVNKMRKTYVKESISAALAHYPGTLSDLQNILLARVVVPGFGLLDADIAGNVDLFELEGEQTTILPGEKAAVEGFDYGWLIDSSSRPCALVVVPAAKPDVNVGISFVYPGKGYDLNIIYNSPKRNYSGTLELGEPNWNGNPISPIKINNSYRKMNFEQFIKSF